MATGAAYDDRRVLRKGFAVAGIHAFGLLKNPGSVFHAKAFRIALVIGATAAIIQPLQGDRLAKQVAVLQPAKLAAMESLFHTSKPASLVIGGIPSEVTRTVRYGIHIPKLLSFLAHGETSMPRSLALTNFPLRTGRRLP
jgi:cytochrome d ubiquinol oxidase subunit I